jgi:16S rRNA (adenine1518-N6/adenine1519-N6)-dimethyltransferase
VEEVRVARGETVLEIGPGKGALTERLAAEVSAQGGRLILVELDDDLVADLERTFRDQPHVEVVHGSILDFPASSMTETPTSLKVVGNIPYNLTSPIIFHLLTSPRPAEVLLMVQHEVAERITAPPGGGTYGALSIGVRAVADVERVLKVPAGAFRPRPRVDSAVIRILPHHPPVLTPEEEDALRNLTRSLFQWRRKQLGRILRDHPDLPEPARDVASMAGAGGVRAEDRPEIISPEGFREMARWLVRQARNR